MKSLPVPFGAAVVVAVASSAALLSGCPAYVQEAPPAAAGPALLFAPLPDAFRLPDDDVDEGTDGLQVDVQIDVENQPEDGPIASVTLTSADGFSDSADVEADNDGKGHAILRASLEVGPAPEGADNTLVATASVGDASLEVTRTVIGLDLRVPPTPPPPTCDLAVDTDGDATVTCSGGDPDSSAVRNMVRGGLVSLRVRPSDDDANFRIQLEELQGGTVVFAFPFTEDGSYSFTALLVDSEDVVGEVVGASAVVDVDVE